MKCKVLRIVMATLVVSVGMVLPARAARLMPSVTAYATTGCLSAANSYRTARGLAPLRIDSRLTLAAQRHANYQASIEKMSHTGSGGTNGGQRIRAAGYWWSAWTENVAYGFNSCSSVMRAWMNSYGHRLNILNGRMVHVGFGAAVSEKGYVYWTMNEARPG